MNSLYTRARLCLSRSVVALAALAVFAIATPALAQNVVLNPAIVQGTVSLTGQTMSSFSVSADWTDNSTNPPTNYSASTSVNNSNSYSLIVNVPQGSTPSYTVSVSGYLNGSGQYYYFGSQTVTPDPDNPQTLNFSETPAILQGTVTATGGTLSYFYVYTGSGYGYFYNTTTYSLVVHPGTSIYAYGYGYDQYGGAQFDQGFVYFDVLAGDTKTLDWTVTLPAAPPTGEIDGTLVLNGAVTPSYMYTYASGNSSASATSSPFAFPNLNAGSYNLYAYAYFGASQTTYLGLPDSAFSPARSVSVSGGATTNVSISATEAFLNGTLTLGGTTTLADTSSANLYVYGAYPSTAQGGFAGTQLPPNGAYSFVVTDGSWSPYYLNLSYSKPDLNETLYFYDYNQLNNPIALNAGQTVTKNVTYAMGTITVNFQALGGAVFSYPSLYVNCSYIDSATQQTKWTYAAYSSSNLNGVTQGGVTFTGMAGDCTIQASAYANGSNYVTFGNLTATMVPGTIQVIDIGGPSLAVNFPEANYLTTLASVIVTGTANDESVDIASITVNGSPATFALTGNALHPHEVSFSATVPLNLGANTLTTVATAEDTDVAGKQASDTRTVFYDPGPLALAFTPADGSSSAVADITIAGTASDPAGIQTVLVNGSPVSIAPDANPGEVAFSLPFTLSAGDNFITVVATGVDADEAHPGQTITQTHKVTLSTQSNPVISAVGGTFAYTGSPHAGSGSATGGQGESLAVTLTYSGTGSTVYGPTSLAPVNAGSYQVVAHTDGNADTFAGDSLPASLVISKADALIVVPGYSVTYDGNAHTSSGSATGVTGESLGGLSVSGTTHTAAGTYSDSWTFTDSTGNYNNASGTVSDKVARVALTVKADNKTKTQGSANPMLTATITGFVPGESVSNLTGALTLTTTATTTSPAGTYPIVASGVSSPNYTITFVNGTLTITAKEKDDDDRDDDHHDGDDDHGHKGGDDHKGGGDDHKGGDDHNGGSGQKDGKKK